MMNEKRFAILDTALSLFYEHGIHAVGINEIIKSSGVAKKTMYHHFASKEALIVAALQLRDDRFTSWISGLFEQGKDGQESITQMFYGLDDWFNNRVELLGDFRGCFFINASAEYREPDSLVFHECKAHKKRILGLINAQVQRFIADEPAAQVISSHIGIIKEGCITSALVQNDKQAAVKALPMVQSLITNSALYM